MEKFRVHSSIVLKLSLGFLIVGVLGIILAAFFFRISAKREFDRFLRERNQPELVDTLSGYYQAQGGWDDLPEFLESEPDIYSDEKHPPMTIIDADGGVVYSHAEPEGPDPGAPNILASRGLKIPIQVDNEVVGWVIYAISEGRPPQGTPEANFLSSITMALLYTGLTAATIAVIIGFFLARTLTRPIRELTEATQAVAGGDLNQQVTVRTRDELGELAASFNRMSADLVKATELRQQMTADVAHELRTPLSVILGYTEALAEGKLPGDQAAFQAMHTESLHLQRLIEDLRTLSLADAGELPLMRLPVSVDSLLNRVVTAHKPQAQARGIALEFHSSQEESPELSIDPDRITQVLGNLVNNALRYTPEGGTITLAAWMAEDGLHLTVRDNGAGIPSQDLPFIFERFYRGDKSRQSSDNDESGLSLAIARSIVEAHGGTISVDSAIGKGTTFTIRLPASD